MSGLLPSKFLVFHIIEVFHCEMWPSIGLMVLSNVDLIGIRTGDHCPCCCHVRTLIPASQESKPKTTKSDESRNQDKVCECTHSTTQTQKVLFYMHVLWGKCLLQK